MTYVRGALGVACLCAVVLFMVFGLRRAAWQSAGLASWFVPDVDRMRLECPRLTLWSGRATSAAMRLVDARRWGVNQGERYER